MAKELFIGIMTGTSLDGADYSLIEIDPDTHQLNHLSSYSGALPIELAKQLELISSARSFDLEQLWQCELALTQLFAEGVKALLNDACVQPEEVSAIGCHGVTVRHRPIDGYSKQLVDGSLLAHLTGIDVVTDFRMADVAAGGEGAPLVPKFHELLFSACNDAALLNLGGIANLTILPSTQTQLLGFDTGPANTLLNKWCSRHQGRAMDTGGEWGQQGQLHELLLQSFMAEPYLQLPAPKSTGKELFNLEWLSRHLELFTQCSAVDVQHTLHHFTAKSVAKHVSHFSHLKTLYVCGGGVHNQLLMNLLRFYLPNLVVDSVESIGANPDYLEAMAFAWLAFARIHGLVANDVSVTGANTEKVLGAWYHR